MFKDVEIRTNKNIDFKEFSINLENQIPNANFFFIYLSKCKLYFRESKIWFNSYLYSPKFYTNLNQIEIHPYKKEYNLIFFLHGFDFNSLFCVI